MYCYRCGNNNPDNAAYCPQCGSRLGSDNHLYGEQKIKKTILIVTLADLLILGIILAQLFLFHVIPTSGEEQKPSASAAATVSVAASATAAPPSGTPAAAAPASETSATVAETEAAAPNEEKEFIDGVSNSELLDYFCDIGLHIEYGDNDEILKRWEGPIRIQVSGDYTAEDYTTLTKHVDMLNRLGVLPDISFTDSDANVFMYFIPLDEMDDIIPGYEPDNWGYFFLGWDWDYIAREAYIGIATDVTTQKYRNHLILEEVTQALGLMNDSPKFADSIFQIEWTETQSLSDIDIALIRMLYCDELEPGMSMDVVKQILSQWLNEN